MSQEFWAQSRQGVPPEDWNNHLVYKAGEQVVWSAHEREVLGSSPATA